MEQMPRHALGWCAYDAVFLDGPAFAAANEKQLTALARWVSRSRRVGEQVRVDFGDSEPIAFGKGGWR